MMFLHKLKFRKKVKCYRNTYLCLGNDINVDIQGRMALNWNPIGRNIKTGFSTFFRMDTGSTLKVAGNFDFFYGNNIHIFENGILELESGFINSFGIIECHAHIRIGSDCAIGPKVIIMDSDGHFYEGKKDKAPVIIGNNVWIGAGATILKGVTIGNGSVVAAGAVVKCDVPANSLVAGIPAKVVKRNIHWAN